MAQWKQPVQLHMHTSSYSDKGSALTSFEQGSTKALQATGQHHRDAPFAPRSGNTTRIYKVQQGQQTWREHLVSSTKTARFSSGTPFHLDTGRPSYAWPSCLNFLTCENNSSSGIQLLDSHDRLQYSHFTGEFPSWPWLSSGCRLCEKSTLYGDHRVYSHRLLEGSRHSGMFPAERHSSAWRTQC